ncbi:hypothetical protein G6F65_022210 [Rhizopus arrhizus]|nr:hypothetical protein G6F65_022210 [Rhizopus arrhizus]
MRQRAHVGAGFQAVADLEVLQHVGAAGQELLVGAFLHVEAAARSTSASSNTSTGEWPPNSIVTRFMCAPASAASCLPTGTEPVNDTLRTIGERIR